MTIYYGDDGANLWFDGSGDDAFYGYGGDDTIYAESGGNDILYGGAGNDWLEGGAGADRLYGGDGIDTISYNLSGAGVRVAIGGTGSGGEAQGDVIGADVENISASQHDDVLVGSAAANSLLGLGGNDSLSGLAGDDILDGGDGNDVVRGGAGADQLNGGLGVDTVTYSDGTVGVTVNLLSLKGQGGDAQGDNIANFENVDGSQGGDTLIGNDGGNVLQGLGGNDSLSGGNGNDILIGGAGADHLDGGLGIDTVSYAASTVAVAVDLGAHTASGGDAAGDVLVNIEWLVGSAFNDTLTGDGGANTLQGGAGNDVLRGGAGVDHLDGGAGTDIALYTENTVGVSVNLATGIGHGGTAEGDALTGVDGVYGGSGNDTLVGASGANTLVGNNGNDVIQGNGGGDTLSGGAGADRFVFTALGDSTAAAPDRITDFSHAQGDRIDLHLIDANTTVGGDQAFSFIGTHAFTGHAGELSESIGGGVTVIGGDVNGDGHSDFHIILTGSITLTAGDFVL